MNNSNSLILSKIRSLKKPDLASSFLLNFSDIETSYTQLKTKQDKLNSKQKRFRPSWLVLAIGLLLTGVGIFKMGIGEIGNWGFLYIGMGLVCIIAFIVRGPNANN